MSRGDLYETAGRIIERWGFPIVVAGWLAHFVLMPLLEEHRLTLREVRETQREIANAITEQTRLLYALQPKVASTEQPEAGRN